MKVHVFDSASAFRSVAQPFLAASPVENTIPLAFTASIGQERSAAPFLAVVDDAGAPALAAIMTPTHPLILSTGAPAAVEALVEALVERHAEIPGVSGPQALADRFASAWSERRGQRMKPTMSLHLHCATEPPPTGTVAGSLGRAGAAEWDTVIALIEDFADDPRLSEADRQGIRASARRRIEAGEVFFWNDDGVKAIAAYRESLPSGGRINLVYTPPAYRGKGYATACVAALTRRQLALGWGWCSLFIDESDAIARAMYDKLGFQEVGRYQNYEVREPQAV